MQNSSNFSLGRFGFVPLVVFFIRSTPFTYTPKTPPSCTQTYKSRKKSLQTPCGVHFFGQLNTVNGNCDKKIKPPFTKNSGVGVGAAWLPERGNECRIPRPEGEHI